MSKIKKHFRAIIKTKKSPYSIALGAAVGTLIGTLPLPFVDYLLGLAVVLIFKKVNKYALFASLVFWNPLVKFSIYAISYQVSLFITKLAPKVNEITITEKYFNLAFNYLIANIIVSITFSFLAFFSAFGLVVFIKKKYKTKKQS